MGTLVERELQAEVGEHLEGKEQGACNRENEGAQGSGFGEEMHAHCLGPGNHFHFQCQGKALNS